MSQCTRSNDLVSPRTTLPPSLKKKQRININSLRIRCASRHRIWMTCSTLGSSLGTSWEHPGVQGPEIDDSGRHFEHPYLTMALSEAHQRKMRIEQKAFVLRVQIEVGHPGTSTIVIKILFRRVTF